MKALGKFIFLILLQIPFSQAQNLDSDPHNTYQFNRANVLKGNNKPSRTPWFEWWYYKVVLPNKNKAFYFVYGVVNPWDQSQKLTSTRSYVGMGDFQTRQTLEERFPVKDFNASYTTTSVQIGNKNTATAYDISGDIHSAEGSTSNWRIQIKKKWAFNAESWLLGKNITNIEWYPAQADATCSGEITVNGEKESFTDAPCYQDRNWGSLFPEWWAWIVSNYFEQSPGTTLAIGGGKPTLFDRVNLLESLSIGLRHQGKEYTWRPQNGNLIKFQIRYGHWEIDAINKNYRISIRASAPKEKFMDLQFITPQGKTYHDYEALQGHLEIKLFKRSLKNSGWTLIDTLTSEQAGIEFGSYQTYDRENVYNAPDLESVNICLMGCN